ncbi:hypothetical protein PC129_g8392 [Phytophthora cactorum]|uniref:Uncharacterized protein n=1 Tax=Phytophthora cactorum TaxID=29920 RepID=A0A329SHK4_9STRA|nr:hypothetical protein Pcac1_g8937 [Phytophthora cactorum]KAG2823501.1 hypothetical protein PC112_g10501 [Phytophthora cactorum]KAG2832950.1 hypothetical protein PC111_g6387 [Phytophthora cactorum]KAG2860717.1 hypothetical protein PC113_g7803 [Phytophthora cactorum]KAG2915535.1 hypothetical protein PC114_g7780 [Phytophthora cactorum]
MARAVTGSRAVETYLRNFEGEKSRFQEIMEITLCYGVQCLARTFSLKGISCNELRAITSYDTVKTRDFYVRNASQPIGREASSMHNEQVGVRAKPSHSWRDGEVEMPDFPESSGVAEAATKEKNVRGSATGEAALYSLPPPFDEIDFHTKLLGKQFVDLAWKIFAGREGAQISTRQELEEKFVRVDQRKVPTTIPALELPVASFAEFLGAYVTESVRQSHRTGHGADDDKSDSEEDVAVNEKKSIYGRRSSVTDPRRRSASTPRAAMGNTKSQDSPPVGAERKQRPLHPQPQQRHPPQIPRSLQRVQSKIQPELDARRQKILRVKKTQSQRMAETLARARLAEYDARRELQDVRDRRLGPKKMPISEITKGAAALEIVDDFMKSPLMDKFGRENLPASSGLQQPTSGDTDQRAVQKDPLKEELYGTAALDSSFVGCKPAPEPRRRSESRRKQLRRNYNGWLGDFGPLHTKTVRPEWDEVEGDDVDPEPRAKGTEFEWNFEHLPGGRHETVDRPQSQTKTQASFEGDKSYDGVRRTIDHFDDISDALSVNSDPVFRWLKDAV